MYNSKDMNLTSSSRCFNTFNNTLSFFFVVIWTKWVHISTYLETFDGPFYSNGEWIVSKKEAIIKNTVFTSVELKITLQRRTTIYTYFIVLPYLLSVLFILTMMIVQLNSHQRIFFAGCSIFIQLSLIMFVISHIGFWSAKAPRAVRCMSINIFFTICTVCLSIFLTIRNESMKSRKLPLLIDTLLDNEIIGRVFILRLDSSRLDSNLLPFVNEDENERTNDNSIEIEDESREQHNQSGSNILVLEQGLAESELFNLKRWFLFRALIDRLTLYAYLVVLITFHI